MLGSLFKDLTKIFGKPGSFSPYTEQYISISAGGEKVYERGEKSEDVSKLQENAKFIPAAVAIDTQRVFKDKHSYSQENPWGSFPLLPLSMPNQPQLDTIVNARAAFYVYPWNAFNVFDLFEKGIKSSDKKRSYFVPFPMVEAIVFYSVLSGNRDELSIVKDMPEDFKRQLNPDFIKAINQDYRRVIEALENTSELKIPGYPFKTQTNFKDFYGEWSPKLSERKAEERKRKRYEVISIPEHQGYGYVYNTFDNPMRKKVIPPINRYNHGSTLLMFLINCYYDGVVSACEDFRKVSEALEKLSEKINRLIVAYYIYRLGKHTPYLKGYDLKELMRRGGKIIQVGRRHLTEHRKIYDGPVFVALEGTLDKQLYEIPPNYQVSTPIFVREGVTKLRPYVLIYQEGFIGGVMDILPKDLLPYIFSVGKLGEASGAKFAGKLQKENIFFRGAKPGEGVDEWDYHSGFSGWWDSLIEIFLKDLEKKVDDKFTKYVREDRFFSSRLSSAGAEKYFGDKLTFLLTPFIAGATVQYLYFKDLEAKDIEKILGIAPFITDSPVDLRIVTIRSYKMDEYAAARINNPLYFTRTVCGPELGISGKFVHLALRGKEHIIGQYLQSDSPIEISGEFSRRFNVKDDKFYEKVSGYANINFEREPLEVKILEKLYVDAGGFPVRIESKDRTLLSIYEVYIEKVGRGDTN